MALFGSHTQKGRAPCGFGSNDGVHAPAGMLAHRGAALLTGCSRLLRQSTIPPVAPLSNNCNIGLRIAKTGQVNQTRCANDIRAASASSILTPTAPSGDLFLYNSAGYSAFMLSIHILAGFFTLFILNRVGYITLWVITCLRFAVFRRSWMLGQLAFSICPCCRMPGCCSYSYLLNCRMLLL